MLKMTKEDAIEQLAGYNIKGEYLYLVDIIPLIEMIWADGKAQEGEIKILTSFLKKLVKSINEDAGYEVISFDDAKEFTLQFLRKRPDQRLMSTLRTLVATIINSRFTHERIKKSILAACLDIASSSVVEYPYGLDERFDITEKHCFYNILKSLE